MCRSGLLVLVVLMVATACGGMPAATAVITGPTEYGDLAWSPDGTRLAFATERDGDREIFVVPVDGSAVVTQLTDNTRDDGSPAWSPDGARIAFASDRDGQYEIYLMGADGSDPVRLTDAPESDDTEPAWSPDGSRIAFASDRDDQAAIYIVGADGSGLIRLTDNEKWNRNPAWSPDGTTMAFVLYLAPRSQPFLYTIGLDGTNGSEVSREARVDNGSPCSWSPDGEWLAFAGEFVDDEGWINRDVFAIRRDGSGLVRLTDNPDGDWDPAWSPDGTRIAFASYRGDAFGIYTIPAPGR